MHLFILSLLILTFTINEQFILLGNESEQINTLEIVKQ